MMSECYYTFILASKPKGALFVGTTSDLVNCVLDHKCNLVGGITSQYAINQLVYYECHEEEEVARKREQTIRQLHRIWKLDLIDRINPYWRDLYDNLTSGQENSRLIDGLKTVGES